MNKYDKAYMKMAACMAETSESMRLHVGCVIVKNRCVVGEGLNGTPPGYKTNVCEDSDGTTHPFVIHAEMNAILKSARWTSTGLDGATLYTTHSPCANCAKHIAAAGIARVVYALRYRDTSGLDALTELGVTVEEFTTE